MHAIILQGLRRRVYATFRYFNGINSSIVLVYDIKNPPFTLDLLLSPQSLAPLHPSVIKTIRSKQDTAIEAYLNQIEVNRAVCGIDEIIIDTYLFGK